MIESMKVELLNILIDWYFQTCYCETISVLNGFSSVYDCAYAHYTEQLDDGTTRYICDVHQRRVGNRYLEVFANKVVEAEKEWQNATDFERLLEKIKACQYEYKDDKTIKINRIGPLAVYDCAARITWLDKYNHLRPEKYVYLHSNVTLGAKWLREHKYINSEPINNKYLVADFDDDIFSRLFDKVSDKMSKSMLLESFMCNMMKTESPLHQMK